MRCSSDRFKINLSLKLTVKTAKPLALLSKHTHTETDKQKYVTK